jgi:hypothetical protein
MADHTADRTAGRRRASGIYGSIVTAAILTSAGGQLPTLPLAIAVVVTLLVYWTAEEYAELLGGHVDDGKFPGMAQISAELRATWPMVTASYGPLGALLLARLAGASPVTAANAGLAAAVMLLVYHAWSAARAAQLRGTTLIGATCAAGLLGVVMILMKNLVLVHLH